MKCLLVVGLFSKSVSEDVVVAELWVMGYFIYLFIIHTAYNPQVMAK
jgi:hypothetical protein